MKRNYPLLLFILALIALLSGNLTKKVSFVGRIGINLFYKEYKFFKIWWQSALVCFVVMLAVAVLLFFVDRSLKNATRKITLLLFFFVFLAGLYFTYKNFRNDFSYRLLGERFHLGIYLYWIGCCITSLFYALTLKGKTGTNNEARR
jgi:hypothetical protein